MVEADAAAVYAAGWDEQALFDAISVCALFNLMNRIIEGSGVRHDPLSEDAETRAARRARMGGESDDPHRAPRTYTKLLAIWGVAS
jgi:hypothetical protein